MKCGKIPKPCNKDQEIWVPWMISIVSFLNYVLAYTCCVKKQGLQASIVTMDIIADIIVFDNDS